MELILSNSMSMQLLLALPFLVYDWKAYLSRAFEFSRVFLFKWTVNWRFLPEEAFLSSRFSAFLLVGHALTLFWAIMQWCKPFGGFVSTLRRAINKPGRPVSISANLSPRCRCFNVTGQFPIRERMHLTVSGSTRGRYTHYTLQLQSDWNAIRPIVALSILRMGSSPARFLGLADAVECSGEVCFTIILLHVI